MNLEKEFVKYIEQKSLFSTTRKVILAVSGGIDSMVMVDLFQRNHIPFIIAHCNFGLRGIESDGDELLVGAIANKHNVPFVTNAFDTIKYANENNISIQIAARELRYTWFSTLASEENIDSVALAHHADDVAETMLINLCRGTGISGLHGILPRNGLFVRPLLFAQRADIVEYANDHRIKFREDSTNKKDKYTRNNIRLNVLPVLKKSYPEVINSFSKSASIIANQEQIYKKAIDEFLSQLIETTTNHSAISISKLLNYGWPEIALFEALHPLGFNASQVDDVLTNIQGQPGAKYSSNTHQLTRDRSHLFISKLDTRLTQERFLIHNIQEVDHLPIAISFEELKMSSAVEVHQNEPNSIIVDADKIVFPLVLRKWEQGDYFTPFGMTGKKKVSDYFQDIKLPSHLKTHIYILESNKKIIWIVGYRMSELLKINKNTLNLLKIMVD